MIPMRRSYLKHNLGLQLNLGHVNRYWHEKADHVITKARAEFLPRRSRGVSFCIPAFVALEFRCTRIAAMDDCGVPWLSATPYDNCTTQNAVLMLCCMVADYSKHLVIYFGCNDYREKHIDHTRALWSQILHFRRNNGSRNSFGQHFQGS